MRDSQSENKSLQPVLTVFRTGKCGAGFTLIELMIVVAIIGILAGIAVPIYTHYIYRSKQTEAKTLLSTLKAEQEEYRAENNEYADAVSKLVKTNEISTHAKWYTLSITTASTYGFTAEARGSLADSHPDDIWWVNQAMVYATHTGSERVY